MTKDTLDTIKRLSAARHDGEASWGDLTAALDEAAAEIEDLNEQILELEMRSENQHTKIIEQRIELGELRYTLNGQMR